MTISFPLIATIFNSSAIGLQETGWGNCIKFLFYMCDIYSAFAVFDYTRIQDCYMFFELLCFMFKYTTYGLHYTGHVH